MSYFSDLHLTLCNVGIDPNNVDPPICDNSVGQIIDHHRSYGIVHLILSEVDKAQKPVTLELIQKIITEH